MSKKAFKVARNVLRTELAFDRKRESPNGEKKKVIKYDLQINCDSFVNIFGKKNIVLGFILKNI